MTSQNAADQITLTGLRVRGHHGVLEQERRDGQDFIVDVTLFLDTRPAAASDDLAQTVDYGVLAEQLAEVIANDPVDLIETVAQRLAEVSLSNPLVEQVTVTLHKPQAPINRTFTDVAVTITRSRADLPGV